MNWSENQKRILGKTSEELMRKYLEHKTVGGRSFEKREKGIASSFVRMGMCSSGAIKNLCLTKIYEVAILARTCAGIRQDDPSKVSGVILAMVVERVWYPGPVVAGRSWMLHAITLSQRIALVLLTEVRFQSAG